MQRLICRIIKKKPSSKQKVDQFLINSIQNIDFFCFLHQIHMKFYILIIPQKFHSFLLVSKKIGIFCILAISEYVNFNQEDAQIHKFINLLLCHVLIFNFIMYHTLVPIYCTVIYFLDHFRMVCQEV